MQRCGEARLCTHARTPVQPRRQLRRAAHRARRWRHGAIFAAAQHVARPGRGPQRSGLHGARRVQPGAAEWPSGGAAEVAVRSSTLVGRCQAARVPSKPVSLLLLTRAVGPFPPALHALSWRPRTRAPRRQARSAGAARMLQPHGFRGWFCAACGKVRAQSRLGGCFSYADDERAVLQTHERAAQAASTAEDAAARQDPPPRCAVVIAEGVAEALASDQVSAQLPPALTAARARCALTHGSAQGSRFEAVHAAARHGCCGFVALRALLATDATPDVAAARCVGTLLCPPHADDASLAKRFRGLRCGDPWLLLAALSSTDQRRPCTQGCSAVGVRSCA